MKKLFALSLLALGLTAGCHAQVPPSPPPTVALTWTAPAACTTAAPCVFAISRTAIAAGGCPTPSTTGTQNYALIGTTASNATTFTDANASAGNIGCYIAQTQQGTPTLTSVPSNVASVTVPNLPAAPTVLGGTATAELAPEKVIPMPEPTIAKNEPLRLKARFAN